MKRKVLSVLFAMCFAGALCSCGKKEDENTEYDNVYKVPFGKDVDELKDFDEIVLYEDDLFKAVLKDIEKEDDDEYVLSLKYENNSDRDCYFNLHGNRVNGMACEAESTALLVAAGDSEKTEAFLGLPEELPEDLGEIKYMDFTFYITYNDGDYAQVCYLENLFEFTKSKGDYFERKDQESDVELLDNDSFKVVFVDEDKDRDGKINFSFYYENKEKMAGGWSNVSIENFRINGEEVTNYGYWSSMYEKGYETISVFDFALEEEGIKDIETVEFDFVYTASYTDDIDDEVVVPMYIEFD